MANSTIRILGRSGYSGYSGLSGYSGESGQIGASGYSGAEFVGSSGYSGYSGESGYSGFSGLSGYSGESGYSGFSGFSGISGYSGYSGESGNSGYSGTSGYSGYSGKSGYSGYSGQSGYSGYSGESGYSGYSGQSGFSGYSGYSGYSGFSGVSGMSGFGQQHATLADMPDSTGVNTDHDTRYATKVQPSVPAVPTPFEGMLWYDTGTTSFVTYFNVVNVNSGPYTVPNTGELIVCSGSFDVLFPSAIGSGRSIIIKNNGLGVITAVASGSQTIEGNPTQELYSADSMSVVDVAVGQWVII